MSNSLITKALKALPPSAPESQKKLLRELGAGIPDEDLDQFDVDVFIEMVASQWQLANKRPGTGPRLRLYSPIGNKKSRKLAIDVVSRDKAFLVDSVVAEINKNSLLIDFLTHPILYADYDAGGRLVDITSKNKDGYTRQSHIHIQIKDTISDEMLDTLETGLHTALNDVFIANRDWPSMLEKLKEARQELAKAKTRHTAAETKEYCQFLDYLHDNNFTLLGYREYEFAETAEGLKSKTLKNTSLGLLHDNVRPAYINENDEGLPRNLQELRRNLPPVSVSKTNRLATVHRRVPMDAIAVKTYDKTGNVRGEKLFIGLFTSVTYSRSVGDVPFLRQKVEDVMEMSDFLPQSHNRKALRHILEKYPRDELFQIPVKELYDICLDILRLQERQHIALFMRRDPFGRYISCLVYVPRDRFGTNLRKQIGKILETKLGGTTANFYTSLDDSVFARVMFIINVKQKSPPQYNPKQLEAKLQEAGQTWQERLSEALHETFTDEEKIKSITLKYGEAFPQSYTSRYRARQAIFDIDKTELVLETGKLELDIYRADVLRDNEFRLKVYYPGNPLNLSDVLPILDHMGLRAVSELPFEIRPAGAQNPVWIHDFLLETPGFSGPELLADIKHNFEESFRKIWYGHTESDTLNQLVLSARLTWQEVNILRTYVRYLKQVRFAYGQPYVEKALTANPEISRMIAAMFMAYLDPSAGKNTEKNGKAIAAKMEAALEDVKSLDQDRIIRSIGGLVNSTLRTNYFQKDKSGESKTWLSVKLDSRKIPEIPDPKPYREIFVYSPRVEAIHLRGDKIARGGLRWSDRHEDYRTEVLGLMKAQMVKNAVIVPVGAKGGFVVKKHVKDAKEFRAEGIECYKIFIRGLLDITDNLKGEKIIPPKDVLRRDGDDPYLVVAADKGTATFSDTANSISQEYGFWLDDAFASGGSAGYDHKKIGITARGTWESVKLHFRHFNHNTQTTPFDVIGVGDMGGDVFGNGMLQSEQLRLLGAFNHVHIFCDPNPDPKTSFKERSRLFKKVGGWDEYDVSKLSKGGRIYSRSEKVLALTPEIRTRFDIQQDKVSPIELMRSMLKIKTDLLFFGGIGTYIKSVRETHGDVGDKANDSLRVNASEIKAKVIGEGANLALTQRGRVEFAEKGGRLNTDFLDNSAGVDTSDHEVNIKILLADVMRSKTNGLTLAARNALLEKMTGEVAQLVLRDNYQQAQAISLAEYQARENLQIQDEFIQELEREQGLVRAAEGLPDAETIESRLRAGRGLTRPELCILLAYAKIKFTKELLKSNIPDMQDWLLNYFPAPLQQKYKKEIFKHKLRREITAMSMANSLVNRMGPGFIKSITKKSGAGYADIAAAYIIVRDAFQLRRIWDSIEALDNKIPAELQLKCMYEIARLSQHSVTWFLKRLGREPDINADTKDYGKAVAELRKNIKTLITPGLRENAERRIEMSQRDGLPKALAEEIAYTPILSSACDIIRISLEQKSDLIETARTYFEIGEKFSFDWLRQQAKFLSSDNHWQAEATSGLLDQLYSSQAGLTIRILRDTKGGKGPRQNLTAKWLESRDNLFRQVDSLFVQLKRTGTIDLPMLVIAEQRLRSLYGG